MFSFTFCLDIIRASNILGNLDSKYLDKLTYYLNPVLLSSSRSRFVRCWRAMTDGWAAFTFHSNCDGKGPTVTVIKVGSYIFGGYTDMSWSSPSEYQIMVAPFSLSLLFYSGLNFERSDPWIRCSPRQMFTNKLACLVKLLSSKSAGAVRLVKAWSKKSKNNVLGKGRGKTWVFLFLFLLFFSFRFLSGSFRTYSALVGKKNDCYASFQQRNHDISRLCSAFTLLCSLTKRTSA